ncbi:MAG: surface-adhesin E family protein [Pseudomonadota bacterium]
MIKRLILLASLLMSGECSAGNWTKLFSESGRSESLNESTLKYININRSGYWQAWARTEYEVPQKGVRKNERFNALDTLMVVNCENGEYSFKSLIFRLNGTVIHSEEHSLDEIPFSSVPPDSITEIYFNKICSLRP